MQKIIQSEADVYLAKKRRRRLWTKVVSVLGCVVVFCTTYALILPAITMEYRCGLEEHTHSESCYIQVTSREETVLTCSAEALGIHVHNATCYGAGGELVCGYADYVVHSHNSSCFDEDGRLICSLPEITQHVHTDSCYSQPEAHSHTEACFTTQRGDLICTLEETEEHQHTDECYPLVELLTCPLEEEAASQPELICTRPEVVLHTHGQSCYDAEGALICGQTEVLEHVHSDECFTTVSVPVDTETLNCGEDHSHTALCYGTWELSCQLQEHVHSEDCYARQDEPAADEDMLQTATGGSGIMHLASGDEPAATAVDVSLYITDAQLKYKTSGDSEWQSAAGNEIPGDADLRLDVTYKNIPLDTLLSNGGQLTYTIPSILRNPVAQGEIISDGKPVGTISADGNVLTITFQESWLQGLKDGGSTTLDGDFFVESQINISQVGEGGQTTITIGNVTIEARFEEDIVAKNADVDVTKAVSEAIIHEADGDYLEYNLTVTAGMDGCPEVSVKDSFTANGGYVSYVGLSDAAAGLTDSGSPCETIAEGKTHGSVLLDSEGKLVWGIGNMSPNETRTLTYRVKLGEGYTYIQNSSSKVISNEAQVYAQQYPRDKVTANFEPKAGLDMKKTASNAVRQEDGSYIITYTVWVEAYSTNHFVLKNVRIEDRLNHPNNATASESLEYISYVDGSFVLYDNKTPTGDPLAFETSEEIPSNPAMNEDKKGFTAYVGDMAPGKIYCVQYQVRVGLEAIGEAGGKTLNVKNRALAYSDNAKNGGNNWLQAYSNTKELRYDHWAKKLVGVPLTADANVQISGTVYDATGDTPVIESSPPPDFTAPVGSYQYTVTVNELGDWDVTSASMKDTLGDQHMQFVGYVQVDAYDPDVNNAVKKTIWVKVDGTQTFNFTLAQLGLTENTYAYRLTYYAKPVQMEGVSQVVVANTFQLSGDIIIGEGYVFILTGIEASAEVTVQGDNSFEAEKRAWYYEGAKTSTGNWSKGALYWAIKVDGNAFVAGTYLQDYIQYNSFMVFHSDSLVGVYTGSFPSGTQLTSYPDVESALNSGYLTSVDPAIYTMTLTNDLERGEGSFSELTIRMEQTVLLGDDTSLYIIVKLEPAFLPPNSFFGDSNGSLTYPNFLKSSDNGTDWESRGSATKTLCEGSNIRKQLGSTFSYDGTTVTTKISGHVGTVPKNLLPEPGYYVAWEVKVNRGGDLSGKYRIVDTIPEGMELAYVRLKWRGTGTRNNPGAVVTQITDLGDGWTEHTVSAGLDGEAAKTSYFYTNGNQVCWDVDNLVAGKAEDIYSVDFQVVCRVTDPDVLLGGEEKTFNNQVSLINSRGEQHDADTNGVAISTSTMTKSAVWSGSSIPFTITVNPLGEDLLEGTETLTIVDTLSDTLKLDPTTLEVKNTKTQEAVDFTASLDGQILKVIVPDNQPLTVSYRAKVQAAPNTEVAIKNDAHWEGYAVTGGSSAENAVYKYSVGGTAGGTTTPFVEIVKYDQTNLTHFLAGAAFKMVEGTMEDGVFTPSADTTRIWSGTTDESGRLRFGNSPLMAYNTVYQITETAAPPGYILDGSPSYFIVAKANEYGSYPAYPGGVTVYYDSSTYTCEIGNHKGEATVEKRFSDPENQSLEKVNGTYRFGIFNTAEPDGIPLQTVVITIQNGSAANTGKFTGLELGKTYYIYELDDDGLPISGGTLAMVDGKLFDVTYTSGPAVTVPSDGTAAAAVTVTNQVHYTALPQTGGAGTNLYTMGGPLLIAAASLLLLYKHIRHRKEDTASS